MNGASLLILIGHSDAKFRPPMMNTLRATRGPNNASTLEQMRQKIVKYLGKKNVLVGLNVGMGTRYIPAPGECRAGHGLVRGAGIRTAEFKLATHGKADIYYQFYR